MPVELKVPTVGESITEVQIGEWLKSEGDRAEKDEIIAMIETDKVTVELPAPVSGVITKIVVKNGSAAAVGDVIGYMDEAAEAKPKAKAETKPEPEPAKPAAEAKTKPAAKSEKKSEPPPEADQAPESNGGTTDADVRRSLPPEAFARVMPSARRALKEKGLRAEEVAPTGPGGRLLKEDVLAHTPKAPPAIALHEAGPREEEVVAMSPMRKTIAERLVQSQNTAALLTTFNEIDMSAVLELRKQHQPQFQEKYGIKLGMMSFFVKGAIEALKLVPSVNAEIRGNEIVYKNYYDIGVAVGGGRGLVVPVLRNAERMSFAEVEQKIAELAKRAQDNKLKLSELEGGTFTISNGGIYGSMMSTPIINPPQSGILGMHAILERPVVRDGQIVIRPMMYVALTYDHRIVDGREAVTFLKRVKECVENPTRMLLEV
jgi:2-oxoglutarate dehydrogenase E2 component (dihydrolipoamide succinyltransferase)